MKKYMSDKDNGEYIIITCPHCNNMIQILRKEFNCKIFRHGIYKKNFAQIDPHMKKDQCDYLKKNDLIYGCGKPYEILCIDNKWFATTCKYK